MKVRETLKETATTRKSPLDARIVGWFHFCYAVIILLMGVVLITGIGHVAGNSRRSLLFGLLTITSDLSHGVYALFIGLVIVVGGLGLVQGRKYGWWIVLVSSLYCILDNYLLQVTEDMFPMWGLYLLFAIAAWLLLRSKVFGIRIMRHV